ncbi:hypothetical protein ACJIZ3_009839 [Penstemon smallii]|uniref:Protein FAM136A n=1 Tax=Penstemon smallii TaxID=265156 RepID=A0ABD3TEY1_9LAMI
MDDHIAAAEERLVSERMRQKLNEVNLAAQSHLSGVQHHINFTLQQAYFKCAYECFDRQKNHDEISNCVEHCGLPVHNAKDLVETQMAKFQEKLNRSLMVCQDKYEAAKVHSNNNNAIKDLESCVDLSVQDSINLMPHVAGKLKAYLSIED